MNKFLPARRDALRGDAGAISASIPDILVSTIVRIVILTGLVAAVAVMLLMWISTTTSATTSATLQASSLRFNAAVAEADIVKGSSSNAVALMTTSGANCEIVVWRNVNVGGQATLVTDPTTVAGVCTTATAIPGASATARNALVPNVSKVEFSYTNVGGREIKFTAAGTGSLSSAANPAGTATQDWQDPRPKYVTLIVETEAKGLTTFAKNAKMSGSTDVVNFAEAKAGSKFVTPEVPVYAPDAVGDVWVTRSNTTGAVYGGVREGATVEFRGGVCQDAASYVTISWTPTSPAGQSGESATFTRVLNGAPASYEMPRVRNGAEGQMSVAVRCDWVTEPEVASTFYTQEVPDTTLSVTNGARAEEHNLNWTPVSSLPTSFSITYAASPAKGNGAGSAGVTTDLSKVVTHPNGTTYGYATSYTITPAVGPISSSPKSGSVSNTWPAPPVATNIGYTHTGAGGRYTNGVINWGYSASCPVGTVTQAREVNNVVYDGTTGAGSVGDFTVGSFASKTSAEWNPAYALEGFPYQERIDVKCVSPVTGSQSATSSAQSDNFFTPMTAPAAPVYIGFDYRDWVRGDTTGYMTCWGIRPNSCNDTYKAADQLGASYTMDYQTYCTPGSAVRNPQAQTAYGTMDWNGNVYAGYFGRPDGWQLPDRINSRSVQHLNPMYSCSTLWMNSPTSAIGAGINYTVNRIW